MQFESKTKRLFWIGSILGLIPDIVIAAILSSLLGSGGVGFILVLVGLQLVYLGVWLRKTVWSWVVFGVYGRKHIASALADYLTANDYPEPEMYEKSAEEYFNRLLGDESLPVLLRLKAATQAAALQAPTTIGQYQYGMRIAVAYEDAIACHKAIFAARWKENPGSPEQIIENGIAETNEDTLREVNMHCERDLLHVANFDDVYWKKADEDHDLRAVVVAYCAAIDGTLDRVNMMFKPYEDKADPPPNVGLFDRIKFRKLRHLLQLRTYFEFKLKLQLLDHEGRERMEPQIGAMLSPELAEQV